jgi:hypothetical protein
MPKIPDDPKEALLWFYEEYTKLRGANSPQACLPAIGCIQQLQKIGGVGNEENTFRQVLGVVMTTEEAAEEYQQIRRDSDSYPDAI